MEPARGLGVAFLDIDLSHPLADERFARILRALGKSPVLCFRNQALDAATLKAFSSAFGALEVNVSNSFQEPGHPEVMILSNIVENGRPLGAADAGQEWHTDMSYSETVAFLNVLYALKVPQRDGRPIGDTSFADMRAAYLGLPEELKTRLDGMTALHDFDKLWERMRRKTGSLRPPLTAQQRALKPPVSHPVVLVHPISGEKLLYANPGYAVRINGIPQRESDELLAFLFEHQLKPEFCFNHRWTEGDVLVWDDLRTVHRAVADYEPHEHRLIKRCQVMADRIFDPAFTAAHLR